MPRPYFPLFVDISEKRALIVGAGAVAARRAAVLARFCGRITVVAPAAQPEVEALASAGALTLICRAYDPADLDDADLVLACTDDSALNARIAETCRERGIWVNVSSDKALCDFYFPGIAVAGDLVAGVTACGTDHRRAREATRRIQECLKEA